MKQRRTWILAACMNFSLFAVAQVGFSGLTDKFLDEQMEKGIEQSFVYASHPAAKARAGANMLLPEEGLYFYMDDPQSWPQIWEYDDNDQLLLHVCADIETAYNRTFLKKGWNIVDTIVRYRDAAHTIPIGRIFYDYHYYDITPVDSFYVEEIVQNWNEAEQRWENHAKYHKSYADTVMFNVRTNCAYVPSGYDGWQLANERVNSFVYDEQGFVKEVWDYRTSGGSLKLFAKVDFYNNEEGRPDSAYLYEETEDGFDLVQQWYYEWDEWYGFDSWGEGYLINTSAPRQHVPIGNKQNKRRILEKWYPKQPGGLYEIKTSWDAYGSFIDSIYLSFDSLQTKTLVQVESNIYNEYGGFVEDRRDYWFIDEDGNRVQSGNTHHYFSYTYTDYGADGIGCDVEDAYYITWNTELLQYDSTKAYRTEVTRYRGGIVVVGIDDVDERNPVDLRFAMTLSPNPATNRVIIAATEIIEQIQIYNLTGRLLKEDFPKAQQTELQVGNLAPGVYLLKARLKNSAVRTEKLIIQ